MERPIPALPVRNLAGNVSLSKEAAVAWLSGVYSPLSSLRGFSRRISRMNGEMSGPSSRL
jgi:hypothetical protein